MLNACYIEEPTDEEDLIRGARLHLLSYLQETEFITSIENQRVQDQRKPIITDDGRIAVSTLDLQAYLAKTTCQKVSQREAGSMLVAVGGTKYRVTGRKYDQIRRALIDEMVKHPSSIDMASHLSFVAMYLERTADHACVIASWTIYRVSGERVNIK
jgi:hypothetical protein